MWYTLELLTKLFLTYLELEFWSGILHSHFVIFVIFVTFAFREKHGLVRNDFLDCMMELRQAGKDVVQGDVQYAENANIGATFSKLQHNNTLNERGY
jgi:hypothetical protein